MIKMIDLLIILGAGSGIIAIIATAYKAGVWAGKVTQSIKELTEQQKQFNENFFKYIDLQDKEVQDLNKRMTIVEQKVR